MESLLPLLLVLAVLACPLGMAAIGVGAWVFARARGEKKPLSMGCMSGRCEHEEHAGLDAGLKEEVTCLRQEVQVLRSQLSVSGNGAAPSSPVAPVTPGERASARTAGAAEEEDSRSDGGMMNDGMMGR